MITGRKKIALAKVLPLNFWLRITAMKSENMRTSGVFQSVSRSVAER